MTRTSGLAERLVPLREDPRRSAILLDVDGTLAPIVRHAADATVAEHTRTLLIALARQYAVVACVSGRPATDARRIVSIGSLAYIGNHGGEILPPAGEQAQLDPRLTEWVPEVQGFAQQAVQREADRLRLRLEDKGPIAAFHWRGAPDEEAARGEAMEIAGRAESAGLVTHWGRKVLEVRPPVPLNKGHGVRMLLDSEDVGAALYAGDDATDLDAFAALVAMVDEGALEAALRVGVRSDEGPAEIVEAADLVVDGPNGVRELLSALLHE